MTREKFIGKVGRHYASQRLMEAWVSKIFASSTKPVWRLVHDKTSLFYKVFKAKYFPNCSVFEAKAKSGSFAWRSILYSRKLILMGAK